ncbi:MAG TPA: chemotaxis protein CheW [Treponemataceae bacterium]|nr:chemotaxis protein CheW [Treponemataceae bacterium]
MEEKIISTLTEYLTFKIESELYAITVANIKEVLGVPRITRVPRMPDYFNGVINLRGNIIPVLDLRLKFGLGKTPITPDTSIIVTEIENIFTDNEEESFIVGIFSDSVEKVVAIEASSIEPPPKIGTSIDTSFVYGIGKVEDSFVVILNINKILTEKDLDSSPLKGVSSHE